LLHAFGGGLSRCSHAFDAMNACSFHRSLFSLFALVSFASSAALPAADGAAATTTPLADAISGGKVSLNVRLRAEHASQDGLRDSTAITVRPRLGWTSADLDGWQAGIEFENITALDGDAYNQAGLNPGGAGRTVIADPTTTEVNQAWLAWAPEDLTAKLGRQRIVCDNARFVGDVGWRQNMQTFDAAALAFRPVDSLTVDYAYVWQVNRVFGREHPQGQWESDSHLLNAAWKLPFGATLSGYAWLLDFDNAAPSSTNTLGASLAGTHKLNDEVKLVYRAEFAHQTDAANNPADFAATYLLGEIGAAWKPFGYSVGYEILGSDNNQSFRTPLATLHAFNGWADVFLNTPATGLRDLYLKVNATPPGNIALAGRYHRFEADAGGTDFGDEFDLQATYKINKSLTAVLKGALFNAKSPTLRDVDRFWLQLEYAL
jgi:hypothetical protein